VTLSYIKKTDKLLELLCQRKCGYKLSESVDTIKLLTFHLNAFLKAGSIFESNFWNISEISGCLDVT